jgi:hypothetical protein
VPHFEKMLYDNAMLARVYTIASRAFGGPDSARIARETLDFLLAEMTPPEGGFFAAQDADSGGREGTFYVWNPESLSEAVGADAAPIVAARFGVTPQGNFEDAETVLSIAKSHEDLAREFGKSEGEIQALLAQARRKMYAARARRTKPGTDTKLLTDWTALTISALALGARVLEVPRYEAAARQAADRVLANARKNGQLLHVDAGGSARIPAFASDYAYLIEALLDLYEATFEVAYFRAAVEFQSAFEERFRDPDGGYAMTETAHEGLILRPREAFDGATPSSNSVAAMNLLRLESFTGERRYGESAEALFSALSRLVKRAPTALPRLLSALDYRWGAPREIVLSGTPGEARFESLRQAVFASPGANRVLALADREGSLEGLSGLVEGRRPVAGPPLAYVCRRFACSKPISDPGDLRAAVDG